MRLPSAQIFVLPHEDRYLVYAPLRGLVFAANEEMVAQLRECCETRDPRSVDPEVAAVIGGTHWLLAEQNPVLPSLDRDFAPARVTLFLTNRCNLRCIYCYAEGGDRPPQTMDETLWRAAIDEAFTHAQKREVPLHVGCHGGGEPSLAWEQLTGAVEYAEYRTRNHAPGLELGILTNGMLNATQVDFLARHFPRVLLSMDGPRDIQDHQRPRPNGAGSFDRVMASLAAFRERELPFSCRATITAYSVRRMTEIVDFFAEETNCRLLFLEPAFECGRCVRTTEGVPAHDVFAEEFSRAFRHGISRGLEVQYSATWLTGPKLSFCGVAQDSFNVTPDGLVTACFEVCEAGHPLAPEFVYGRFDRATGRFHIEPEVLHRLRTLLLPNKSYCDHCFARWQCAGDCPARVRDSGGNFQAPSPRCELNQRILKEVLVWVLEGNSLSPHRGRYEPERYEK